MTQIIQWLRQWGSTASEQIAIYSVDEIFKYISWKYGNHVITPVTIKQTRSIWGLFISPQNNNNNNKVHPNPMLILYDMIYCANQRFLYKCIYWKSCHLVLLLSHYKSCDYTSCNTNLPLSLPDACLTLSCQYEPSCDGNWNIDKYSNLAISGSVAFIIKISWSFKIRPADLNKDHIGFLTAYLCWTINAPNAICGQPTIH